MIKINISSIFFISKIIKLSYFQIIQLNLIQFRMTSYVVQELLSGNRIGSEYSA